MKRSVTLMNSLIVPILASLVASPLSVMANPQDAAEPGPAGDAEAGEKTVARPANYSASVRWFFLNLNDNVPSHRLARYLAVTVADDLDADVAIQGDHIKRDFPAGAWLATRTGADGLHGRVRRNARRIGTVPSAANTEGDWFPLSATARILDLVDHSDGVQCRLRLRLRADESAKNALATKETEFTSLGGASGMHVFVAAIPEALMSSPSRNGLSTPSNSGYLVLTVNVRGEKNPQQHQVSQTGTP